MVGLQEQRVPNRLRESRIEADFSQLDVARILGLYNTTSISQWENSKTIPNTDSLFNLSALYKKPIEYLLPGHRASSIKFIEERLIVVKLP